MGESVVFVIRDERYGSAIMRGIQQAQTMHELGVPTRLLSLRASRSAVGRLVGQTIVLVKDAVLDEESVVSLATGGNRIVWDVIDFFAHNPDIAGVVTPAERLAEMAISVCLDHGLVMTTSCGELLQSASPSVSEVTRVDHQVDRALANLEPAPTPEQFGVGYLGASENVPEWVPTRPDMTYLLTSDEPFIELVTAARRLPFHVDFRNPRRDRRQYKPWTKAATALHLGAVPIVESTEANIDALGSNYPLLFDGTRHGFLDVVDTARKLWDAGEWSDLRTSLHLAIERSSPRVVASELRHTLGLG